MDSPQPTLAERAKAALPFYDRAEVSVAGNPIVLEAVAAFLSAATPEAVLALRYDAVHAWDRVDRGDARAASAERDLFAAQVLLRECGEQFRHYERQPRAKMPLTDETLAKAEVNRKLAERIEAALGLTAEANLT